MAGEVGRLAVGRGVDVTRVHNTTDATAISIHVYGTDVTRLGSSARRYYD